MGKEGTTTSCTEDLCKDIPNKNISMSYSTPAGNNAPWAVLQETPSHGRFPSTVRSDSFISFTSKGFVVLGKTNPSDVNMIMEKQKKDLTRRPLIACTKQLHFPLVRMLLVVRLEPACARCPTSEYCLVALLVAALREAACTPDAGEEFAVQSVSLPLQLYFGERGMWY